MYDAVHVLAKSLDDLSRMSGFNPMPINCMQGGGQWRDGQRVVYNMRNMRNSPAHGLTGEITFDEDGFRTDFKLELLEKRRDLMMKTGVWEPDIGLNFTLTPSQTQEMLDEKLQNKTLRVSTTLVRDTRRTTNMLETYIYATTHHPLISLRTSHS